MNDIAPDGDLGTWLELHGPLASVDALVLLNQICAQLQELSAQGLEHHDVVPSKVLLRSEEDGLVPVLAGISLPTLDAEGGLDRLLWTMLAGEPAPSSGLPRLGGNDELSQGFNDLFALLGANGSLTAGLEPIRSALTRLANRARSAQDFTPVPIAAPIPVRTEQRDVPLAEHAPSSKAISPQPTRRFGWFAVLAAVLILIAVILLIA